MTMTEYASVLQKSLDKQIAQKSVTGWMEDNAKNTQYSGGKFIKIGKVSFKGGMSDYDREKGYSAGAAEFAFETFEMKMDRNKRLHVDRMDVEESGFTIAAANLASEFQRVKVIPEIDSYRIMKLAQAAAMTDTYTPTASTLYSKLMEDIGKLRDVVGDEELVIMTTHTIGTMIDTTDKISKFFSTTDFTRGNITTKIQSIDNIPVIRTPGARMKSNFVFYPGNSDGDDGGFASAADAKNINWIITVKTAPVAVSKTDNLKIIVPDDNQRADGWDLPYRKYHDIFIPENQRAGVLVSYSG